MKTTRNQFLKYTSMFFLGASAILLANAALEIIPITTQSVMFMKQVFLTPTGGGGYPTAQISLDGQNGNANFLGNVGIGTTTPATKLEVAGAITINPYGGNLGGIDISFLSGVGKSLIGWNRSNGGGEMNLISNRGAGDRGGFRFIDYHNGVETELLKLNNNDGYIEMGAWGLIQSKNGPMHIGGSGALFLLNTGGVVIGKHWSSAPTAGNLEVQGNLGIGIPNPQEKLHVKGNVIFDALGGGDAATGKVYIGNIESDGWSVNPIFQVKNNFYVAHGGDSYFGGHVVFGIHSGGIAGGVFGLNGGGTIQLKNQTTDPYGCDSNSQGAIQYKSGHFYGCNGNGRVQLDNN